METVDALAHPRFSVLTDALVERLDEVTGILLRRSRAALPDIWGDATLESATFVFARQSIEAEMQCFADHARLPDRPPEPDVEGARQTAQLEFPLSNLLWGYRAGHSVQWDAWFDLVESDAQLDAAARRRLLEAGSAFFFAYADRLMGMVTDTYTVERERVLASLEQRRVQLVRELLEGGEADAESLDYELDAEHVGLIAWGPDAGSVLRDLAQRTGRRLLLVPALGEMWWGWLGGAAPLEDTARETLARAAPPEGTGLAMGLSGHGREGFRATHEQAVAAYEAALRAGQPVVRFADVALEVLASADAGAAQQFVARELAGLDGTDTRSTRLRATLSAYFAAGHNAAAAAAALGVHEQTVAARIRAVEERLGHPAAARRAELETALRLRRFLAQPTIHAAGASPAISTSSERRGEASQSARSNP